MGKKSSLAPTARAMMMVLKEEGYTERQLVIKFSCSKTGIHQAVAQFKHTGSYCKGNPF